jgi:urease gamma subunit
MVVFHISLRSYQKKAVFIFSRIEIRFSLLNKTVVGIELNVGSIIVMISDKLADYLREVKAVNSWMRFSMVLNLFVERDIIPSFSDVIMK